MTVCDLCRMPLPPLPCRITILDGTVDAVICGPCGGGQRTEIFEVRGLIANPREAAARPGKPPPARLPRTTGEPK